MRVLYNGEERVFHEVQNILLQSDEEYEKIADAMADTWAKLAGTEAEKISFTLPEERKHTYAFSEDDLVVVGVPTYAGRVPNLLVKFLKTVEGNGRARWHS